MDGVRALQRVLRRSGPGTIHLTSRGDKGYEILKGQARLCWQWKTIEEGKAKDKWE